MTEKKPKTQNQITSSVPNSKTNPIHHSIQNNNYDIIIPIYNAYNCLTPCINSVLKNTDFTNTRLILIDDKSPDNRVLPLLEKNAKTHKSKIILLKNRTNLGFVKTVNKAIKYSQQNVVLLNSDTIVTKNWLTNMIKCADADESIATVTPFSNNLTPMKPLPETFRKKGFPEGMNLEKMAKLVQDYSLHLSPEIPSSHGFCMLIKKTALSQVGYFDEDNFGKGYGEENDFCFRCLEYNYKHVMCDNAYVFHAGTQSFLHKTLHPEVLLKKHPQTMQMVGSWYNHHEIDIITDNILLAIATQSNRTNILITLDSLSPEDFKTAKNLAAKYNLHILESSSGNYILHSFFKDSDLTTAIYYKPITIGNTPTDSNSYQKMLNEIQAIYGISVILDCISETKINKACKEKGKNSKIDYLLAKEKLLEYDKIKHVIANAKNNQTSAPTDKDTPIGRTPTSIAPPKRLTIPQRIYLKIRYKLFGW